MRSVRKPRGLSAGAWCGALLAATVLAATMSAVAGEKNDAPRSNSRMGGDCLLIFSDGAFEIHNAQDEQLGVDGLLRILRAQGYPQPPLQREAVEEELLKFSNAIRLDDDVTFIDVRIL